MIQSVTMCKCLSLVNFAFLATLTKGLSPMKKFSRWNDLIAADDPLFIKHINRRAFVVASSCTLMIPGAAAEAVSPPYDFRSVDVGGGFDLMTEGRMKQKDALFPISMEGVWVCDRIVTAVEGDAYMAQSAWTGLGGTGPLKPTHSESYQTRFVRSSSFGDSGIVMDRGFEIASRTTTKDVVAWNVEAPDTLQYASTKLKVVQRSVELPSDKPGFGFDELVRIDDGLFVRAAQIKRRYRRGFDENGARFVEGLEIMKTFRVLDGIAGTELPTSVTKSRLTLRRPST